MRVVIQRVREANVKEGNKIKAKIGEGLLLYLAVAEYDTEKDVEALAEKIAKLRLFPQKGKIHDFQKSISDIKGEVLVIPNYTLYGDLNEGNRPYFGEAASPGTAQVVYSNFLKEIKKAVGGKVKVKNGTFGATMDVMALNYGPATVVLETTLLEEDFYDDDYDDDYSEEVDDLLEKLRIGDMDV